MRLIRMKVRNPGNQEGHWTWINVEKVLAIHDWGKSYCALEMENREAYFFVDDPAEVVVELLDPPVYVKNSVAVCKD